jgi:hypothetical protein
MRPFTLMDMVAHRTVMLSSQVAERRDQFRAYYEIDQQAHDSTMTLVLQLTHGLATIESVYTIIEMVCKMWEDEEQRALEMAQNVTDTASRTDFNARRAGLAGKRDPDQ